MVDLFKSSSEPTVTCYSHSLRPNLCQQFAS